MKYKKKDLRFKPRWLAYLRALFCGYFWMQCPLCGKNFGGFESEGSLYTGNGGGVCVCNNCSTRAEKLSKKIFKKEDMVSI